MPDAADDRRSSNTTTPPTNRQWTWGDFAGIAFFYLLIGSGSILLARLRLDAGSTHRTPALSAGQEYVVLLAPLGAAVLACLAGLLIRWTQRRTTSNLVDTVRWTSVSFVLLLLVSCGVQDELLHPGSPAPPAPATPTTSGVQG